MPRPLRNARVERPSPSSAVAVFVGEHDRVTVHRVHDLLASLIEENDLVVADFSEAEFVDSSILHVLVQSDKAARECGHRFRLQLGTAPIVHRAFEISGLLEVLDCAPTREEALRGVAA
jgi:anti-anti-sigma factor